MIFEVIIINCIHSKVLYVMTFLPDSFLMIQLIGASGLFTVTALLCPCHYLLDLIPSTYTVQPTFFWVMCKIQKN